MMTYKPIFVNGAIFGLHGSSIVFFVCVSLCLCVLFAIGLHQLQVIGVYLSYTGELG